MQIYSTLCHKPHSPASVQLFANYSNSVMVDYSSRVKLLNYEPLF